MKYFSSHLKMLRNVFGITQEQLAKALSLEYRAIVAYETGKRNPPVDILLLISKFYGLSFDFIISGNKCDYPRNIRLLNLAKTIDNDNFSDERNSIEGTIKAMWSKILNTELNYKQDHFEIELSRSFHKNLKEIRNLKKMTQAQLAKTIDVSRSLYSQYEAVSFPPLQKLIDLSEIFNISIHALVSGQKLFFDFDDKYFGKIIISVDQQLPIHEHKTLTNLLEATISNRNKNNS